MSKKLCYIDVSELSEDDYTDTKTDDGIGGEVDITYYSDGTSKVHWGGPCGSSCYDENGEEC